MPSKLYIAKLAGELHISSQLPLGLYIIVVSSGQLLGHMGPGILC